MRRLCPALLLALLLLGACQRDDEALQWVELTAERYNGSKVAVSGDQASWVSGEQVRINGTVATITLIDGHYYIEATAVNPSGANRALYPATLGDGPLAADAATISLPQQYRYSATNGIQHIELPMAASSQGQSPLLFRHLTGALRFNIVNNLGTAIVLDRLTVESDRYSLSGSRTIDFGAIDATAPAAPAQDTDRTVVLVFGGQTLASGDSLQVVMPIAPVGADNHFTVSLSAHHEGTRYTFSRTQTSGGALARNQLGHAKTPLSSGTTTQGPLFGKIGSGTNPYNFTISTPEDFVLMVEAINNGWNYFNPSGQYIYYNRQQYTITSNIDMSGHYINTITNYSGSSFDGEGHTISNLTINGTNNNCALFASLPNDATFENIVLKDITLNCLASGYVYIAPIACTLRTVTIHDCEINSVMVNISGNPSNIYYGGIAALSQFEYAVRNCNIIHSPNLATNNGQIFCGGIVGRSEGNSYYTYITNCNVETPSAILQTNSSNIYFGGLVGSNYTSLGVLGSKWSGDVQLKNASTAFAGGLAGWNFTGSLTANSECMLTGSFNTDQCSDLSIGACIGRTTVGFDHSTLKCAYNITLNGSALNQLIGVQQ